MTFRRMTTTAVVAVAAILTMAGGAAADAASPPRHIGFGQPGGPMVPPLPIKPAQDAPDGPSAPTGGPVTSDSRGSLELTLSTGVERAMSVTLTCGPAGGTHPGDITAACEQLNGAQGDVSAIDASGMLCTKEFDPVTARVLGTWDGREVRYERRFGNACEANAATGGVLFGFWQSA